MIFSIALALMAIGSTDEPEVLRGSCDYDGLQAQAGVQQVGCDAVVITHGDGLHGILIQFSGRGFGSPVGFAGALESPDLSLQRVYLRPGVATPATGRCRLFEKDHMVTGISCVARTSGNTIIANFRATPR